MSFAVLSVRHPSAVICLVSAAAYHGLTTANPPEVWAAFPFEDSVPQMREHEIRGFRWREAPMTVGVEEREIAGVTVKMTSPARTVVDLIRLAKREGLKDVAIEALRNYTLKGLPPRQLADVAKELRGYRSVRAYLDVAQGFKMS